MKVINMSFALYYCDSMQSLSWSESVQVFYRLFIHVLLLEIQLSKRDGWHPIKQFNPTTFLYARL